MNAIAKPNPFSTAENTQLKLRMAVGGVSGAGKTWFSLVLANFLGKTAVIDTENDSASRYLGEKVKGLELPLTFDRLNLTPPYSPERYIEAIDAAVANGYDVVVIDSASHEWIGEGGVLSSVDKAATSTIGWKEATPRHTKFLMSIIRCPIHLIATVRYKDQYVLEQDNKGKWVPRKVGIGAIQRDQFEFEFDIGAVIDLKDHAITFEKSRCPQLDAQRFINPGTEVAEVIQAWLTKGHGLAVSESDLRRLAAIAKAHNWELEEVKTQALSKFNVTEMSQLDINQLRAIVAMVSEYK